jgi:hypothetical protein
MKFALDMGLNTLMDLAIINNMKIIKNNPNCFTDRDLWVLEKPDFFSISNRRNKIKRKAFSYKKALKLARKISGNRWYNQCLVYAVRESAQTNLNHRKIYKTI